eukprot:sb/3477605/
MVCDRWLRFKTPPTANGEQLVHKAAKIREQWSGLLRDVLNHKVGDLKEFQKKQTRLQKQISRFLRSDVKFKMSSVKGSEAVNMIETTTSSVQLTENITLNTVKVGGL